MQFLRALVAGVRGLFSKDSVEHDLHDEVEHYLELATREHLRRGLSPDDARRAAKLEIGGVDTVKENVRDYGWEVGVETFWMDVRYAVRRLRQNPGFTFVAVASLALGIGANSAIFSMVDATLLRQLPVREPDQLVYVRSGSSSRVFSYPDFDEIRRYNTVFSGVTAWGGITVSMGTDADASLEGGAIVTGNYFDLLGVRPVLGRLIGPSDDQTPGAHPVIVLSDALWLKRFNRDRNAIGKQLQLDGHTFTVIGVLPPDFGGAEPVVTRGFYVPMMMQAVVRPPRGGYSGEMSPDLLHVRGNRWLYVLGRLKSGVTIPQARASLLAMIKDQLQVGAPQEDRNTVVTLEPLSGGDPRVRKPLVAAATLLIAVVGMVLLIACANVANLLLARASSRAREIAVRLSLGATRARLVRQLLTESVLLATLGALAGLALASATLRALNAVAPPAEMPITFDFHMDWRVLGFTLALGLFTGVIFGLAPALRASRPHLAPALKDEAYLLDERFRRVNLRQILVVAQVAVTLVLLLSAGLFLRSLRQSQLVNPGFDAERVLTVPLDINLLRYTTEQGRRFYRDAIERVEALPGVESASLTRWVPLTGNNSVRGLLVQGRDGAASESRSEGGSIQVADENSTVVQVVGTGYFETMGIRLLRGRDFSANDDASHPVVAVVNQAFAARHLVGDPIGQRVSTSGPTGPWVQIVGVAADSKLMSVNEAPAGDLYLPVSQSHETGMTLLIRTTRDPASLAAVVTREVHALEKNLPTASARTLSEWMRRSLYGSRAGTVALLILGGLALLLATVGLYGVMSYAVSRRSKELGLRMALGARSADVLRSVLRDGMRLVGIGLVFGVALAAVATRLLQSFLFGVSAHDPLTFVAVPCVLAAVGLAASYVPARRATRVDPMTVLRQQ